MKELREDFVTNTGKRLAEKAAKCGTSIVLEPLQRKETPFLRQVSDAAKMAQAICMVWTALRYPMRTALIRLQKTVII